MSDVVNIPSTNKPQTISDSEQLRKLELALERIKGYVSSSSDADKECDEKEAEAESEDDSKKKDDKVSEEKMLPPPSMNKSKLLPTINIPNDIPEESSKDNDASILDAAKKNDSFSLKLTETIESCKAKLGISEVIVEDEESSDSESVEEEVEEEEIENEVEEEEIENEVEEEEVENGSLSEEEGSDGSTSESEDESNSEMSDTDIETIEDTNDAVVKTIESEEVPILSPNVPLGKGKETSVENAADNEDKEDDSLIITESPSVDVSNAESNNDEDSEKIVDKNKEEDSIESVSCELPITAEQKNSCHSVNNTDISDISATHDEQSVPILNEMQSDKLQNFEGNFSHKPGKENFNKRNGSGSFASTGKRFTFREHRRNSLSRKSLCDNRKEDEDDDIYICNSPPRKAPTPPLICLDDGTDTEPESENNLKSASAQSLYASRKKNIDIPTEKNIHETLVMDQKVVKKLEMRNESVSREQSDLQDNRLPNNVPNGKSIFDAAGNSLKRKLSSQSVDESSEDDDEEEEEDDDDDIQVLPHVNKLPLTGAKRTFGNRENRQILKSPLVSENNSEILKSPLGLIQPSKKSQDSLSAVNESQSHQSKEEALPSPNRENAEKADGSVPSETCVSNMEQNSSPQKTFQSPGTESGSSMDEKDIEILRLKKKLSYVFTAFQIQHWKHNQEKLELRHNMNLIIMEMRASLEADKKQAIETLSRTLEREKNRCVEEAKKKQWCAYCHQESRYACCWNTSYCTIACQKRHFPDHRSFCTQLKGKIVTDTSEAKAKLPTSNATDPSDAKSKVYVLNMKTGSDTSKPSVEAVSTTGSIHQIPLNKPQIQVVSSKAPLQIVTPASSSNSLQVIPNQNVQLVLANIKATCESTAAADSVVTAKELNFDSAQVIKCVRNRTCNLETAISILQKKNEESSSNFTKEEPKKNEENLEDRYFPSPPKVRFEGFDSVNAEASAAIDEPGDIEKVSDSEVDPSEEQMTESATEEEDLTLSDTDDKDNEMVNIGHGIDVKAKFLNKCLIYGTTPKRLTRCLIDVIFPDIRLLASCSAFGQKSNVTKLTRAALPARKVSAIIDFVLKRYPDSNRSEIVLAINMKCKEARNIIGKLDTDGNTRKHLLRRLLAKEQNAEPSSSNSSDASNSNPSVTALSPASAATKSIPNVVCIKSSSMPVSPNSTNVTTPIKSHAGPNILRCSPQILIRPKPVTTGDGPTAVITPSKSPTRKRETIKTLCGPTAVITPSKSPTKKRETVKTLLSAPHQFGNLSKDGTKIVMPLEILKATSSNSQTTPQPSPSVAPQGPFIIIGSPISAVKQTSVAQAPILSSTITIRK